MIDTLTKRAYEFAHRKIQIQGKTETEELLDLYAEEFIIQHNFSNYTISKSYLGG